MSPDANDDLEAMPYETDGIPRYPFAAKPLSLEEDSTRVLDKPLSLLLDKAWSLTMGNFVIKDEHGTVWLTCRGKIDFKQGRSICDAKGTELLRTRTKIMSWKREATVTRPDGEEVMKMSLLDRVHCRLEIIAHTPGGDVTINAKMGKWGKQRILLESDGHLIAVIRKDHAVKSMDRQVDIAANVDYVMIVVIALYYDQILMEMKIY